MSCAKTTDPIEMLFGCGLRWKHVLDGMHIGAAWRIWLNCLCSAVMWPYVKLLWPLSIY